MGHGDDSGFAYRGMAHQLILHVHGADPFTSGLHHVLAAVHQPDATIGINGGHVPGAEPAVFAPAIVRFRSVIVAGCHPWPADFKFANRLAVPWRHAVCVGNARFYEWKRVALLDPLRI